MEYSKDSASTHFDFTDIRKVLLTQLDRSREPSPDSFSKKIHVLLAVNDAIEGQLERQLQEEREDHTGKRIVLIPYCLENSHWVGILLEFQAADQILRAEYIDPVSGSNIVPDRLRKQLAKVYPSAVLQAKDRYKHTDRRFSSALTVKNLLAAVENDEHSTISTPEPYQLNISIPTETDSNRYSAGSQSPSLPNSQINIQSRITIVGNEGNDYTLAEKQQELNRRLEKLKIRNIDVLPQKIREAEELIREYEEEKRTNEAEEETALLKELQWLQNLANEIVILDKELITPADDMQLKLCQMKEELGNKLAELKIQDVDMLLQRIQKTEDRIRKYEEAGRMDIVEKETIYLNSLKPLQTLANEIARFSQEPSVSQNSNHLKFRQMEEELKTGLAKLKIQNIDMLPEKIREAEELIREYEEEKRTSEAEEETAILKELQWLQNVANEIVILNKELFTPTDDMQLKLCQMKEELSNKLAKLEIQDVDMLLQRIQKTEDRIRKYEEAGRMDIVEKETIYLNSLKPLQTLANEIARFSQEPSVSQNSNHLKLRQMEEELKTGLAKLKIQNIDMLPEKIREAEELIREYEEEKRKNEAEEETAILKELQWLQNVANEIVILNKELFTPADDMQLKLCQMKEELGNELAKLEIQDVNMLLQRIQKTEDRIRKYEEAGRMDIVEKETIYLNSLKPLQTLANEIGKSKCEESQQQASNELPKDNLQNTTEPNPEPITSAPDRNEWISDQPLPNILDTTSSSTVTRDNRSKKLSYINDLCAEAKTLPICARKTVMELLVYFEQKLLGENTPLQNQESLMSSLQNLKNQVKREELISDDIKTILQNLGTHFGNENYSDIASSLSELLKKFRSLNVLEIQTLVGKATEAAELIQNKDVVLLIGTTGAGKSTTIQFLAGAQMKEVKVEITPGRFLDHVTAVGTIKNPDLENVTTSPLQTSETRYIAPVTVPLKDVLGAHETGTITLCDAPGFGDTAGPEVDIANSIGVIEALKKANSVKILALLSCKSLGDKGEGVQKLAHILIRMIHGIEDRLDAIVFAFTKFPKSTDINALLIETKRAKVDRDATLKSDTAFVSVLMNMIEKTEVDAFKIEPTNDDPKKLMRKLKSVRGIKNPEEVFRFSMSEETRASISDHVQRDKFSIICAMKYKDIELVRYYLNDLEILKGLMKESFIRDAYEESVRFVSESISNYCKEMMEKFNRVLNGQDGLQEKDILDYRTAMKYLECAQIFKEHLGSALLSPALMLQNIVSELNEKSRNLNEEELYSPLVTIYLRNLSELKNSFVELRDYYNSSCKILQKRFDELVQTARELIPKNEFKEIAEIFFSVFQSARALKNHLHEQVQEAYNDLVKYLLRHLNSYADKAEPLLVRVRLSHEDVETISNYMEILRSAKDSTALQERVSKYLEMPKKKAENSDNYESIEEKTKDLNQIYEEFILKILEYFGQINLRIKELFEKSGDHTLENIKVLVSDMDALRTIPELELKTAGTYYHTVENIRGYTQQLQTDAENLLLAMNQQTGITNFKHLARSLARLKTAEWINQVSPGTYDNLMHRITEELSQNAFQLETNLMKIDLSLKCPENIAAAAEIVEKIESMRDLERSVPELEKYRKAIVDRFEQCTQVVFVRIQKTFDLGDKDVYQIKQKLRDLEEIKRQYESLHPARIFLQNQGYADVGMLNNEIEELKIQQRTESEAKEAAEQQKEAELSKLNTIIREYMNIAYAQTGVTGKLSNRTETEKSDKNAQAAAYLQKLGYARIELVYDQISKIEKSYMNKIQRFQDESIESSVSLHRLASFKKEYDSLMTISQSSPEEVTFLREKGFNSNESLDEAIQERTKVINERGKTKQAYHFTDRLDAPTANSAIVYIIQCEKVGHDRVRENAVDAHENLRKYIREYGVFLKQETNEKFIRARDINSEGGPFMYSKELEMRLQELSTFSKCPHVFDCINGTETKEEWHREFLDFYRNLSAKMEEYKVTGKMRELKDQLVIAQALTCVDHFYGGVFASKGFGDLYRQYQGEMNRECKVAYKTVLDHILKGDYANADMAISGIEDDPLNPRDEAQIKNDLQCSLNKSMRDTKSVAFWLDGKIEREDNRAQIIQIKENIDKIRIACNKRRIMTFLDEKTQANLRAFDNEISNILTRIILRGLNSIEAFMRADSFSEAEHGMETLSQVQRELAGYFTSEDVQEKDEELTRRLDCIVSEVLKRNEFDDISKFSVNPPKDLLENLKKVAAHGSAKFTQAYTEMFGKTRQTFSLAIEEVRNGPLNERSVQIRSLKYALCFLPEELQMQFKLQIEELSKLIADEETAYKDDLDKSFTSPDDDEHAIAQIGLLADGYIKQNMHKLLKKLSEQSIKKLHSHRTSALKSLDEQNIQSAIDTVKKILQYEKYVGDHIPEIKGILENIRTAATRKFCSYCETLANISSIEQTLIVEKAFADILIYLEFSNTSEKGVEAFLPDDVMQKARQAFQNLSAYFIDNSQKFHNALKDLSLIELFQVVSISKKWQSFLEKIGQCTLNHGLVQNLLKEMKEVTAYRDMLSELGSLVASLKNQLNAEFITDETIRFEGKRDAFFSHLFNAFNTLKNINIGLRDVSLLPFDMETFEKEIKTKVERMKNQLMSKASRSELTTKDADDFRSYYNHLVSFDKYFRFQTIDVRQILDDAQEQIFAKIDVLKKAIEKSIADAEVVSAVLVKIKFFAENLSMFERYINDEIDGVLKRYSTKQGTAGVMRLSVELEKTEVGARLISEHSTLSGEDWRKRREKMQKQDDLEYMLKNLNGTDLAIDILRARYNTFKQKYSELLSTYLKTLSSSDNKEPDLEVLVTQTKSLVSTVTLTSSSVTWSRSFKEDIPLLLAHIFAVWTLKNTQHYNAMRDIKESNSYLLMPHIGQIIAIFRLLGVGYEKHTKIIGLKVPLTGKISDDLVNNLVEVGTGEGKSVVMAITACVFALTGIDVNCSCYSEILSTRDKSDFASVFRTLGIEDRIEYGTFNKLCEQLLNQQCNVREKVRDMMITNKNTLAAIDTSAGLRPKVLLIDEVDVFLSDKYYGGMYIPSVYLKDDSIKALLDSIWENKTLKSLKSVKALPAYQTCATKYSNWIFLFDEAIKDMIAALQSYQSSTYIVQNDKIVYVEGESIVDNVVRGYDTVWAYYHENSKGNISVNSLKENVGILINCGRFSYAEMPLEFAYIGGVTGTLRTLAGVEKKILERVYAINKTTFMPSVFGSTNRTFNAMHDVRVAKESEYFMEIREEIRTVCHANRAILVFFESEEKLETFHKSPELTDMKQDIQIITEKVSVKDRELFIKRAATVGKVTLLTRTFGRGTDFICRNQQLLVSGGIHVLQTFFSEELSEEYQIMGRGARQGDRGSYRMILLDKDLEWVLGSSWQEDLPKVQGTVLYESLHQARTALYESKCGAKELGIEQCKADHQASKKFMTALTLGNIGTVKEFLTNHNRGANLITSSRTVLLMDATGSMSGLLSATKETVCTMFERASIVLSEKGLPNDAFQMQFAVYRNYNSDANKILQASGWNTKASTLRAFMNTIGPEGGAGNEAIEIGLWHAVNEGEMSESISQVILIGDAPANSQNEVTQKRGSLSENYWQTTRFNMPTYYATELKKLKDKDIPVHTFYLTQSAKSNFIEIARETSGRCEQLNINSPHGAELLTNFVTEEVLRKTAGDQGNAVVELYRKKYVTFTS